MTDYELLDRIEYLESLSPEHKEEAFLIFQEIEELEDEAHYRGLI